VSARGSTATRRAVSPTRAPKADVVENLRQSSRCNREVGMAPNAASPRAPRHSVGKNARTPSEAPIILPQKELSLLRFCQCRANRHGRLSIGRGWPREDLTNPLCTAIVTPLGLIARTNLPS
jgi:hypothetical protein